METKNIEDLKPDPKNPRTMSDHDGEALQRSMTKFGDLSCVVFNVRTQQLVGGHQRLEIMKKLPAERRVEIKQRFEQPDENGTVALGYIYINNKPFAYREVDWDVGTQKAANIAANRIQGEFNLELLAEVNYELRQLSNADDLLLSTGQTDEELSQLANSVGAEGDTPPASPDLLGTLRFKLDPSQAEVVRDALFKSRQANNIDPSGPADAEALYLICRDYLDSVEQPQA